jgi:glycosyltransferase involved in cell wall biosynthesis
MDSVDVSVITPVFNEERHLAATLERMRAQDFDGSVEFLVVDGRSQDASRAMLERAAAEDPRIRVLDNPARHIPVALNLGLHAARGAFVARMDAHTLYPPDYLRLGVARLRREDGTVSVSGPQIAVADGRWSRRVALALSGSLGAGGARFRAAADEEFEVDSGFTGMWRRQTLLDAGGWDERWLFDEDYELAARLTADGGRHVCLPAMAAEYIPRDSLGRLGRQYWRYGRHKVQTFRRHPEAMRPSQLLPPAVALTAVAAVAAPGPVRRLARGGLGAYATTLAAGSVLTGRSASAPASDVAALPAVYATMHLAYGFGLLVGSAVEGPPTAAVADALRRLASRAA